MNELLKPKWAIPLSIIAVVIIVSSAYALHHHNNFFHDPQIRTVACSLGAVLAMIGAFNGIITSSKKHAIQYVIAFDVVLALVLGFVTLIPAAYYWGTACLSAGACVFGGGILGLLFGMPLGNESKNDELNQAKITAQRAKDSADKAPDAQKLAFTATATEAQKKVDRLSADSGSRNLLSNSASALNKVLAGAGLVKAKSLFLLFKTTSWNITLAVNFSSSDPSIGKPTNSVLGGAIILYFGLLGFISGLFLPAYFMRGWQDGGSHTDDQQVAAENQ